ncbi:DUF4136 domain-containing protein [Patiriisocius hiemis]|uniref:DUF4136 domain-containing protein n=1 Tax=Patiriisocius hiemis TaxID=3075604 RepID=A0ABU2YI20_9FLAO|nr:DUF4136 domain-containing protein [Constantimarinum sp. W242]MDT0556900.1 DUF4136 domain-containing protein [Constantimarinum sp. W242]
MKEDVDYSQYKTYNFYPTLKTGLTEEESKLIVQIIEINMLKAKYKKSKNPDLYINFFAEELNYIGNSNNFIPIGSINDDVDKSIPIKNVKVNQNLIVDFIDVDSDKLIWSSNIDGIYEKTITPKEKFKYYKNYLEKTVEKFTASSK